MTTVEDVLERKGRQVASIEQSATVMEAAQRMNERRIGSLIVADGDRVIGIFTERDVLIRVVAGGRDPAATRVSEVMTTPVACCTRHSTLDECRQVMRNKRIRHLPVVEEGRLCGIISIGDVIAREVVEQEETIHYLNEYLHGTR